MTGSWVQISKAAARLTEATGNRVTVDDVLRLGADDGPLIVHWLHDHYGVLEASLAAYLTDLSASECAGHLAEVVAEHADKPTYRGGPRLPSEIEDDYRRSKDT